MDRTKIQITSKTQNIPHSLATKKTAIFRITDYRLSVNSPHKGPVVRKSSHAMSSSCDWPYFTAARRYLKNDRMTSSNLNIFHVTGHLCGEFTGHRWIPRTKASDAELWCFLWSALNKRLDKQSWGWWFRTPSPHYDVTVMNEYQY